MSENNNIEHDKQTNTKTRKGKEFWKGFIIGVLVAFLVGLGSCFAILAS